MITVYLSGKMSGLAESEYRETFKKAEEHYLSCGFNVINPCYISDIVRAAKPDATYEDFMKEDLKALARCTHIAMLENWENSPGAKREKAEAERLGLEVMYYRVIGGKK